MFTGNNWMSEIRSHASRFYCKTFLFVWLEHQNWLLYAMWRVITSQKYAVRLLAFVPKILSAYGLPKTIMLFMQLLMAANWQHQKFKCIAIWFCCAGKVLQGSEQVEFPLLASHIQYLICPYHASGCMHACMCVNLKLNAWLFPCSHVFCNVSFATASITRRKSNKIESKIHIVIVTCTLHT